MTLFPFLTIYMRSLGITETELAFIYLFTPLIGLLGPPVTGLLADRIGNFKLFLSFLLVSGGFAAILFLAVPVARVKHDLPDLLPLNMTCSSLDLPPDFVLEKPYECDLRNDTTKVQLSIQYCRQCGSSIENCGTSEAPSDCHSSPLPFDFSTLEAMVDHNLGTPNAIPSVDGSDDKKYERNFLLATSFACPVLEHVVTEEQAEAAAKTGTTEYLPRPSCLMSCRVVANTSNLCLNTHTMTAINPSRTFFSYLFIRLFNGVLISTSFTLFTGAAMAVLRETGGDYGLQKLYSNLGSIVLTPISGSLIDYISKVNGFQDFRPAFYLYCCIKVLCGILILFIDLDFRIPNTTILRDCKILLRSFEINAFLFVMIVSGICFGLLDTFLFWFLQDLGANKKLMGLTVTVGYLAGIPMLMLSDTIIKRLGHVKTIVLGLLVYVVRMIGYSLMNNPWMVMPFEALESITVSLSGAAAVTYAGHLATPTTLATLQGLYGGLHYGVGNGLGSLVGGFLLKPLGPRLTFRLTAVVSGTVGFLYYVLHIFFFRKNSSPDEQAKPEEAEDYAKVDLNKRKTTSIMENVLEYKSENTFPGEIQDQLEETHIDNDEEAHVDKDEENTSVDQKGNISLMAKKHLEDETEETSAVFCVTEPQC
ncbi:uncharacterized protein LOC143020621 isoform X2 [Oratosquilla oratoria]